MWEAGSEVIDETIRLYHYRTDCRSSGQCILSVSVWSVIDPILIPLLWQMWEAGSEVIDETIRLLEDILHNPDTDVAKRKFAEFKLPDSNNDGLISRAEVSILRCY
jgi:hypothetical protein